MYNIYININNDVSQQLKLCGMIFHREDSLYTGQGAAFICVAWPPVHAFYSCKSLPRRFHFFSLPV